jgi:hypothetical protein
MIIVVFRSALETTRYRRRILLFFCSKNASYASFLLSSCRRPKPNNKLPNTPRSRHLDQRLWCPNTPRSRLIREVVVPVGKHSEMFLRSRRPTMEVLLETQCMLKFFIFLFTFMPATLYLTEPRVQQDSTHSFIARGARISERVHQGYCERSADNLCGSYIVVI